MGVALSLSMVYIFCNVNPEVIVSFWFGMRFKAFYLPWVLLGINILTGGTLVFGAGLEGGVLSQDHTQTSPQHTAAPWSWPAFLRGTCTTFSNTSGHSRAGRIFWTRLDSCGS